MPPRRSIPKRVFQLVALGTLPLPFGLAWLAGGQLTELLGVASPLVTLLVYLLVLLATVLLWAAALVPLRRRSMMPTLGEELDHTGARDLGELFGKAQQDLHAMAQAGPEQPALRRSYHLRMAGAGALLAVILGGVSYVVMQDSSVPHLLSIPVLALVSGLLALYHGARALLVGR